MSSKKAIFLTGGGARGAYQSGVLKAIAEISPTHEIPVDIISGVSSGAINAAFVAARAEDFNLGTKKLVQIWSGLSCGQIFEVNNLSLLGSVSRTLFEVIFHQTPEEGQYLLDTSPLQKLLEDNIDFSAIQKGINQGLLDSLVVTALNYETSETVAFYNTRENIQPYSRFRYYTERSPITCKHILASTAIPLFFPSVQIEGIHYGDGSLRNNYPLRSTISMGADKIIIVNVNQEHHPQKKIQIKNGGVSFGKMMGMIFNSMFLDNIELDVETLGYINNNMGSVSHQITDKLPYRKVDYLYLRPSVDLGYKSLEKIKALPKMLRYLIGGFGSKKQSSDLISYLMFEAEYCQELIALGYQDTMARKEEVIAFLI